MLSDRELQTLRNLGHEDAADEIERLRIEIARLLKGEYICQRCGLRKNSGHPITHEF